jgi:dTDP-4-dehydrorhamnose reductase
VSADILLTGASGQLGWETARRAKSFGLSVHACGHAELDIADPIAVRRTAKAVAPKVIVNAAAYTAVDKAESDKDAAFAVNGDGPAYLASTGVPLIHISTDYVFDGAKSGAYLEGDPVAPLGIYGASKLTGEEVVRALAPKHVILRTAWVYGVAGNNFVKTMLRLGRERDVLRVVDDQHGCPTFAGDLADAVLSLAKRIVDNTMPADGWGTFHCTGSGRTTWCGFARRIFETAGPRLTKTPRVDAITTAEYPTPARRPANSVLDCSKLTRIHGITLRPWEAALKDMLDSTLATQSAGT